MIKKSARPIALWTANGLTLAEKEIVLHINRLDMDICAFVLNSTPDVLSLGRHCAQHGFEFHWKAWVAAPTWTKPNGEVITLPTENFVPYLDEEGITTAPASTTKLVHQGVARGIHLYNNTPRPALYQWHNLCNHNTLMAMMLAVGLCAPRLTTKANRHRHLLHLRMLTWATSGRWTLTMALTVTDNLPTET